MPGTLQALAVLFILLPGFLAAYILQSLVSRPKQSDLEKLIEALILSFVIYLVSAVVLGTRFPVAWNLVKDSSGNFTYEIQLAWWKLLFLRCRLHSAGRTRVRHGGILCLHYRIEPASLPSSLHC